MTVVAGRLVRAIECCMILFRTANIPVGDVEARGVALVFQAPGGGGSIIVSAVGLPRPETLGGNRFIAWIRGSVGGRIIRIQLRRSGPTEVWTGALNTGPGEIIAPFTDIIVTAEGDPPFVEPSLGRIALIGLFRQCRP